MTGSLEDSGGSGPPRQRSISNRALIELPPELLDAVFGHPTQGDVVHLLAGLISELRQCQSPDDFMLLQAELFRHVVTADQRRAEAAWSARRIRKGSAPPSAVEPPPSGDPSSLATWQAEEYTYARIVRQLRVVGDGLAWRLFRYDRQKVLAIAGNAPPGPLIKRADDSSDHQRGLDAEIEAVNRMWLDTGQVALLNGLTNCLRIGDVTLISDDGTPTLREIKNNDRYQNARQRRRIDAAERSIELGTPLPRSSMKIVDLEEPYVSDLTRLAEVIGLSRSRGAQGARLSDGRAIVAVSSGKLARRTDESVEAATAIIERERTAALRRAGIGAAVHRIRSLSTDQAARVPQLPPYAIYPFPADVCALLICDQLFYETWLSVDTLGVLAEHEGLRLTHDLPTGDSQLDNARPAMHLSRANLQLSVYPNSLAPLLHELIRPSSWVRSVRELLDQSAPDRLPWTRLADDAAQWLPPVPA